MGSPFAFRLTPQNSWYPPKDTQPDCRSAQDFSELLSFPRGKAKLAMQVFVFNTFAVSCGSLGNLCGMDDTSGSGDAQRTSAIETKSSMPLDSSSPPCHKGPHPITKERAIRVGHITLKSCGSVSELCIFNRESALHRENNFKSAQCASHFSSFLGEHNHSPLPIPPRHHNFNVQSTAGATSEFTPRPCACTASTMLKQALPRIPAALYRFDVVLLAVSSNRRTAQREVGEKMFCQRLASHGFPGSNVRTLPGSQSCGPDIPKAP